MTAPTTVSVEGLPPGIERGYFTEAHDGQALTLEEFRELTDTFPRNAKLYCDGRPIVVAGRFGERVLLDTGLGIPEPCPACHVHGCDGRCREP